MPMAELADAIVESGRATLLKAVEMVESYKPWGAKVVYGDTDSLFVHLPGRSLEEAHRIGKEMASRVSASCPPDVVLKFEKVYLPCILASKKRYVGNMFESPKQLLPHLDAKARSAKMGESGIETVRRDGCPLVVKMLEKVLRLLFASKDLSKVKGYLYRQWWRILSGRAAVGDFIFAKEVRLGTYASDTYLPPAAIVASKKMASDPRAEPKYSERVPYVVVCGPPGIRLMDQVRLQFSLSLLGVNVHSWFEQMPRPTPRRKGKKNRKQRGGGGFVTDYFDSDRCMLCGKQCAYAVCSECSR
ncbi:unnamed protein product [Discosporangium mesarthrocarpum]